MFIFANKKCRSFLILVLMAALFLPNTSGESNNNNAIELLRKIEKMLVDENVQYTATIKVIRDKQENEYDLTIWMKGRNFVSRVERPILDKGTIYLNVETNTWVYYPSIEKTVKSSSKQKILGSDFSVTDLASVNLLADYDHQIITLEPDEIKSLAYFDEDCVEDFIAKGLVIEAVAKPGRIVNYPKVRCFINSNHYLIREEFYTLSGRMLGILIYEDYGNLDGKEKPRRMIMRTTLHDERFTVLTYEKANYDLEIPEIYFSENFMSRLSRI